MAHKGEGWFGFGPATVRFAQSAGLLLGERGVRRAALSAINGGREQSGALLFQRNDKTVTRGLKIGGAETGRLAALVVGAGYFGTVQYSISRRRECGFCE